MKHTLQIRVSKKPVNSGAVSVRNVSVRERFMRFLLGDKVRLTVIVPGSTVVFKKMCLQIRLNLIKNSKTVFLVYKFFKICKGKNRNDD